MMADWSVWNRFFVEGGLLCARAQDRQTGSKRGEGRPACIAAFEPGVCQGEGDGAKHCLWQTGTGGWWRLGFSLFYFSLSVD